MTPHETLVLKTLASELDRAFRIIDPNPDNVAWWLGSDELTEKLDNLREEEDAP